MRLSTGRENMRCNEFNLTHSHRTHLRLDYASVAHGQSTLTCRLWNVTCRLHQVTFRLSQHCSGETEIFLMKWALFFVHFSWHLTGEGFHFFLACSTIYLDCEMCTRVRVSLYRLLIFRLSISIDTNLMYIVQVWVEKPIPSKQKKSLAVATMPRHMFSMRFIPSLSIDWMKMSAMSFAFENVLEMLFTTKCTLEILSHFQGEHTIAWCWFAANRTIHTQ